MKTIAAATLLAATLALGAPALAQTSSENKVSTSTSTDNGVATRKVKVTHVTKHKTRRPKKILGVKVGHKTVTHKTVTETKTSSNGNGSTSITTR